MIVTEPGRAVLRHALRVMAELEEIRACRFRREYVATGAISIGMLPTASEILCEPLVTATADQRAAD